MKAEIQSLELPLLCRTPDSWAEAVLEQPLALLSDHAYLEKKAASNALELLNRWPEPTCPENWVVTLSAVARDEASHLHAVARLLDQRGGRLERLHRNLYANDLRKLVRKGSGSREVLDRLLVAALIEARSCERFKVLARCCPDSELAQFYRSLWSSEFGHYAVFLRLAEDIVPGREVQTRWEQMVEAEAPIMTMQPSGPRIHSGLEV
jgi:tRNA 2-(methylsulfanyl)-N6-isopentenyladenosine37 hydroxylase